MIKILLLITLSSFFFTSPSVVRGACPTRISTANITIGNGENCSIPSDNSYFLDSASSEASSTNNITLSISAGGTLTINNRAILNVPSLNPNGGSIIIQNGGRIEILGNSTGIWVNDADADGYTPNLSTTYTATAAGRRRIGLMKSSSNIDCYDNNINAFPSSSHCSSTHRGDGSYDYNCSSTQSICGTQYGTQTTSTTPHYNCVRGGSGNYVCVLGSNYTTYNINTSSPLSCGAVGYTCSSTGYVRSNCSGGVPGEGCIMSLPLYCLSISSGTQSCQ